MNNRMNRFTAILMAFLLSISVSYATPFERDLSPWAQECTEIARNLSDLAELKFDDDDSGYVKLSAAYIHVAGMHIKSKQYKRAGVSMSAGENQLRAIILFNESYSSLINPYLVKVKRIANELNSVG